MYNFICSTLKKGIAQYLLGISFLVIPLYIRNGYLNLTAEKAKLYLQLSAPALFFAAVLSTAAIIVPVVGSVESKDKNLFPCRLLSCERQRLIFTLWAAAAWTLFSAFLSPDRKASLCGTIGWMMGALMLCVLIFSTICIAAWLPDHPGADCAGAPCVPARSGDSSMKYTDGQTCAKWLPGWFFAAGFAVNAAILVFALLQAAGMDPFSFLSAVDRYYVYSYLSTIGQKNCFSGYLCLVLPFFWGAFLECRTKARTMLFVLLNAPGFLCAAIADSDSLYAGFGICLLFLLPYVQSSKQRTVRSALLLTMFGGSLLTAGLLPLFSDRVSHMEGISAFMLRLPCACCVFLSGLLLYIVSSKSPAFFKPFLNGSRKRSLRLAAGAAAALAIAAGFFWSFTHFSDSFGTNRGLIWRIGWEQFLKAPLLQKIAGIGPGMLSLLYAELRISHGINVNSAHCEPLHILLTLGMGGFCLYILFWWNIVSIWIKHKPLRESERAVCFLSLTAFWGQSLFCPLYPLTAALLSAVAGLCIHFCCDYPSF